MAGPVLLRRQRPVHGPALVVAINESLAHLAPWMEWAQAPASPASIGPFLDQAVANFDARRDFGYVIVDPATEAIVGGAGLHARIGPGALEIGYWVHVGHTRRGIATAVARALRDEAHAMGVARVELHCDERNVVSAGVARRAGFTLVRTESRPARTPGESDVEMIWQPSDEMA